MRLESHVITCKAAFGAALDGLEQMLVFADWVAKHQGILAVSGSAEDTDVSPWLSLGGNVVFPQGISRMPVAPSLTLEDLASALARYVQGGLGAGLNPWVSSTRRWSEFMSTYNLAGLLDSPPEISRSTIEADALGQTRPRHRSLLPHRTRKNR